MRSSAATRHLWIEAGIALLMFGLAVAAFVRSEMKPLNVDELKINVSDMRTLAATGEQLAQQYLAGSLTDPFFYTQAQLLQEKVASTRKSLDSSEPEPDVVTELGQARQLAANLDAAFNVLTNRSQDVSATKSELGGMIGPWKQLEEHLKQKEQNK